MLTQGTKARRAAKKKAESEPDLNGIYFFRRPNLLSGLEGKKISKVFAGSNFCYALDESSNELYSWGMGYNYVLGTREEENEFEPVKVHPKMFHELAVRRVGAGSQHVAILTTTSEDTSSALPMLDFTLPMPSASVEEKEEPSEQED